MQVFSGAPEMGLVGEIGGVHHQRLTIPMAARVAEPLPDIRRQVRTAIQRNGSHVVDHFIQNDNRVARLNNLKIVVVGAGKHGRAGGWPQQAALGQRAVLRAVGRVEPAPLRAGVGALLSLRRHGRDSTIRRIDDE
jgi:hypothetical protein